MNDRINKTSICSIVFLDIIDYSEKSVSQQIEVKNQFNSLINQSLKGVAKNERIILDTGDGAAIAHIDSPEDALFVSLSIRDEILKNNIHSPTPLYVRFGINLGPVRVVSDINSQPNIIGDGINVAQRVMSFAKPNQILASRSYYEVTSRLTQEISQMFDYAGVKKDKHAREHEIYTVRLQKDAVATDHFAAIEPIAKPKSAWAGLSLRYALPVVLVAGTLFALAKVLLNPIEPTLVITQPPVAAQEITPKTVVAALSPKITPVGTENSDASKGLMPNETLENALDSANVSQKNLQMDNELNPQKIDEEMNAALEKEKLAKKKAKKLDELPPEYVPVSAEAAKKPVTQQAKTKSEHANQKVADNKSVKTSVVTAPINTNKSAIEQIVDDVKNGDEHKCSQAEIAMNQCR
jgi:class 3 adenylate cyclase